MIKMGCRRFLAISSVFVIVVAGGDTPCPDVCTCPSPYRVDCCNSSLTHIPKNLVSVVMFLNVSSNNFHELRKGSFSVRHIKILDLSNNRISVIENDALIELEDLIFLYIGRNEIVSLDQDVFRMNHRLEFLKLDNNILELPVSRPFLDIPSLKSLDMSSCNIRSLPEKTFVRISSLTELRLTQNRIQTLDSKVFLPLKSLKSLYLSGNLLRTLQKDLFAMLQELVVLDLSYNELQTLHPLVFTFLESAEILELSGNRLETLGVDVFTPLTSLKRLHLHKNMLNTLNRKQFSKLNNLAVLDLSDNHLDNLQLHIICDINNLTYLKVSDNQLACNCSLWELWKWSEEKGVRIVSTCEEPDFKLSAKNFESFQHNKSCNAIMCGVKMETKFPEEIVSHVFVYVITCVGLLLVVIACAITTCVVVRYRKEFCKKRNIHMSAIECSQITNTLSGIPYEEYIVHVRHQQDLQKELCCQHQDVLLRNRVQRERSKSLKALPIVKHQNIRHSYHEYHSSSAADNEREWSNADTLPSNKRSSVYLASMSSHPIKHEPLKTLRDLSDSEPKLKNCPKNVSVLNRNPLSISSLICQTTKEDPVLESVHDVSSSGSETVTHERL
jgi:Leucine-rich repeat (LRR) protein